MIAAMAGSLAACTGHEDSVPAPEVSADEHVQVLATMPGDIWAVTSRSGQTPPVTDVQLLTYVYILDINRKPILDDDGNYQTRTQTFKVDDENIEFDGKEFKFSVPDLKWHHVATNENNQYQFALTGKEPDGTLMWAGLTSDVLDGYAKPLHFPEMQPRTSKFTVNVSFKDVRLRKKGVWFDGAVEIPEYACDLIVEAFYYPPKDENFFAPMDNYKYIDKDDWDETGSIMLIVNCFHADEAAKADDGSYTFTWSNITPQPLTQDNGYGKQFELKYFDEELDRERTINIDLRQVKVKRAADFPTEIDEGKGIFAVGEEFCFNRGEHIVLNIVVYPYNPSEELSVGDNIELEAFTVADDDYENELNGTVKLPDTSNE